MEKEKHFTVGQVAEFMNLSKSKIRYWDDMGLLTPSRNQENGYRLFDIEDILTISDIAFYRKLDIPINKMKNLYRRSPEELWAILDETEKKVSLEMANLEIKHAGLKQRKKQLLDLIELKEHEFIEVPFDIRRIISIDLNDPRELQGYIENPTNLVIYIDKKNPSEIVNGFAVELDEFIDEPTIWQVGSPHTRKYQQFLLILESENPQNNNAKEKRSRLEKAGFSTGTLIGRYVMTMTNEENKYIDYYKAWIEID